MSLLVPRTTWTYGQDHTEGLYNPETVLIHRQSVINEGKENCHRLTAVIVGVEGAGKSSLIRAITGTTT